MRKAACLLASALLGLTLAFGSINAYAQSPVAQKGVASISDEIACQTTSKKKKKKGKKTTIVVVIVIEVED